MGKSFSTKIIDASNNASSRDDLQWLGREKFIFGGFQEKPFNFEFTPDLQLHFFRIQTDTRAKRISLIKNTNTTQITISLKCFRYNRDSGGQWHEVSNSFFTCWELLSKWISSEIHVHESICSHYLFFSEFRSVFHLFVWERKGGGKSRHVRYVSVSEGFALKFF